MPELARHRPLVTAGHRAACPQPLQACGQRGQGHPKHAEKEGTRQGCSGELTPSLGQYLWICICYE